VIGRAQVGGEPHSASFTPNWALRAQQFSSEPRVGRGSLGSVAGHQNVQPKFDVARFRLRRLRRDRFSGNRRAKRLRRTSCPSSNAWLSARFFGAVRPRREALTRL
jgi:hypothetical protein